MKLSEMKTEIAAAVGLLALGAGGVTMFQTQKAAAEDKKEVKAENAKSVNELRAEFYLARIKEINKKEEPTKDEQDEKDRLLTLVKAIEAETKVKEAK